MLCCRLIVVGQASDKKFRPDKNISKYINKRNSFKTNAIYLSVSDYVFNQSIHAGFQRRITNWYWAELGFSSGMKSLSVEDHWAAFMGYGRYGIQTFNKPDLANMRLESIQEKLGIQLGLYRTIVGLPPVNSVSYGFLIKKQSFHHDFEYENSGTSAINDTISASMNLIGIAPTLVYKTILLNNIGFDVNIGLGAAFISHAKDNNPHNVLSGKKYTKLDFNFKIKLFYAF